MSDTVQDIEVGGHTFRVSARPGEGPPLLLCNGIGATLDLWQPFIDELDPSLPVVRFDAPGVGGSSLPRFPYTFPALAHRLGGLLETLGYDRFDVLGISWGGGLAQQLAFQNPKRCRRLVLVSTATGSLMVPGSPWVLSKMVTPRRYRDSGFATSVASTLYGGMMRDQPGLAATLLEGHSPLASRRGYLLQLGAAAGWTSLPFLPLIRQQTLILAGDDDPIIPLVNARIMNTLLPHARLHVYQDGHLGLLTKADELAPLVTGFLRAPSP